MPPLGRVFEGSLFVVTNNAEKDKDRTSVFLHRPTDFGKSSGKCTSAQLNVDAKLMLLLG